MNYINFCRNYFALTNIPISLLKGKIPVYSSVGEMLSLEIHEPHAVFWETGEDQLQHSVAIHRKSNTAVSMLKAQNITSF